MAKVFKVLNEFEIDKFSYNKDRVLKNLQANGETPEYSRIMSKLLDIDGYELYYTKVIKMVKELKEEKLNVFLKTLRSKMLFKVLVYGDFMEEHLEKIKGLVTGKNVVARINAKVVGTKDSLLRRPLKENKNRVVKIKNGLKTGNDCILVRIDVGEYKARNNAVASILRGFIGNYFFDELRTKEQLGYVVALKSVSKKNKIVDF